MKKISKSIKVLSLFLCMVITWTSIAMPVSAVNSTTALAMGIDVSKHNQAINWGQVASSGVKFAFIKAGSTNKGLDPFYDANMRGAQAAGIKTGVYLYSYATNVEQAQNEANLLLSWMSNYTVNYPVVYDVEDACMRGLSTQQVQDMINTFCSTIYAAGYYPMVYSFKNLYLGKIGNVGYDKWVAQYSDHCDYPGDISIWQSSSHGSIAGVPTRVDIDYTYKDYGAIIIADGFTQRNGQTYFYAGYKMQRGWIATNDTRYYLDGNGILQKGIWFADAAGTYYLSPQDGSISRGACTINKRDYFFNQDGILQAGPITRPDGLTCYYNPSDGGAMMHGWINDGTNLYYAADDGHMVTGVNTINKKAYFFNEHFILQTNQQLTLDGVLYQADAQGVLSPVPVVDSAAVPAKQ